MICILLVTNPHIFDFWCPELIFVKINGRHTSLRQRRDIALSDSWNFLVLEHWGFRCYQRGDICRYWQSSHPFRFIHHSFLDNLINYTFFENPIVNLDRLWHILFDKFPWFFFLTVNYYINSQISAFQFICKFLIPTGLLESAPAVEKPPPFEVLGNCHLWSTPAGATWALQIVILFVAGWGRWLLQWVYARSRNISGFHVKLSGRYEKKKVGLSSNCSSNLGQHYWYQPHWITEFLNIFYHYVDHPYYLKFKI